LIIQKLSEHTFVHVSYLNTQKFGKVACNGMVFIEGNEAIVFDTPTDDDVSIELINWLENERKYKVKGVVATHFHVDCLGGLSVFHEKHIPSYANAKTIAFATQDSVTMPEKGFESKLELDLGGLRIINYFFGEGHTKDNIVSYIPSEEILFGGCLIKAVGAQKGNLNDANTEEWSNTVRKIKKEFPNIKYIVPGHGKVGGTALLNYTIKLFENK